MNTNRSLPDLSIKKIWNKLFRHDTDIEVLQERPVNNNILINSNFANPVNQRGLNAYNWISQYGGYCIDRWRLSCVADEDVTVTINNDYINFIQTGTGDGKFGFLEQRVESSTKYSGKTLTFSMKYRVNSKSDKLKPIFLEDGKSKSYDDILICDGEWHTFSVKHTLGTITDWFSVAIWGEQEFNIDLEWAKLEEGEHATPYVPRLYAEELQLCMRYYQKLFVGDATLYTLNTNGLAFFKGYNAEMRIAPTCDISKCALFVNSVAKSGFNVSVVNVTKDSFVIFFEKSSHGLTYASYLVPYHTVLLDAEL